MTSRTTTVTTPGAPASAAASTHSAGVAAGVFWGGTALAAVVHGLLLWPYLSDRLMHRDEALTVMIARRPIVEILETVQLVRGGAPVYFLLAHLVGAVGGGLTATRALSAVFGIVAVVAIALLGRALAGPTEGLIAAAAFALSPVALFYSEFGRMYSLFLALSLLALWCLVRAIDHGGRWWAAAAILLTLDVYSHPYGVVVAAIGGVGTLVAVGGTRRAWRAPLLCAGAIVIASLPLAAGYLVLASRRGQVHTTAAHPLKTPPFADVLREAFAHFLGASSPSSLVTPTGLYLLLGAGLTLIGIVRLARRSAYRAALCVAWLGLPVAVMAVAGVPGTANHVRYIIEVLPAVLILAAHGAVSLGRSVGQRAAVCAGAALLVLLLAVEGVHGRHLPDYRYRGAASALERSSVRGDVAFVRRAFAPGDVFFNYTPAWGYAVVAPGPNRALASARGIGSAEAPLVIRSLEHLHGSIAHGWYSALIGRGGRFSAFQTAIGPGFETRRFGSWVVVRTRNAPISRKAFARAALRVYTAADQTLHDPEAPTTRQALTQALPGIHG